MNDHLMNVQLLSLDDEHSISDALDRLLTPAKTLLQFSQSPENSEV